jgi:hypothetical protein
VSLKKNGEMKMSGGMPGGGMPTVEAPSGVKAD